MENGSRPAEGRHRKVLRASAIDMHALATDMRRRRGHIPPDEPPGYVDAFSAALRDRARLLEGIAGSSTCAQAKKAALELVNPHSHGSPEHLAHERATGALLTIVNMLAQRERLDPYEGLRRGDRHDPAGS